MQSRLHFFAYVSLVPLLIMGLQFQFSKELEYLTFNNSPIAGIKPLALASGIITLVSTLVVMIIIRDVKARRRLLEHGLLSIHSCAIMWQVVVLAHTKAIQQAGNNQVSYMRRLSEEADQIRSTAHNIYEWIEEATRPREAAPSPAV